MLVAKEEKDCDEDEPDDRFRGDCWDHVALDPEHRLVVAVVPGERTAKSVEERVSDVKRRLGGRAPVLRRSSPRPPVRSTGPGDAPSSRQAAPRLSLEQ